MGAELLMEEFRAAHQRMFGQLKSVGKLAKLCEGDEQETNESSSIVSNQDERQPDQLDSGAVQSRVMTTCTTSSSATLTMISSSNKSINSIVPVPPPPPPNAKRLITFSGGSSIDCAKVDANKAKIAQSAGSMITNEHGETVKILRTSIPSKKGPAPPPPIKKGTGHNSNSNNINNDIANIDQSTMPINMHSETHESSSAMLIGDVMNAFQNQPISIKVNLQLPTN